MLEVARLRSISALGARVAARRSEAGQHAEELDFAYLRPNESGSVLVRTAEATVVEHGALVAECGGTDLAYSHVMRGRGIRSHLMLPFLLLVDQCALSACHAYPPS